jgi:hypothetical protein
MRDQIGFITQYYIASDQIVKNRIKILFDNYTYYLDSDTYAIQITI